VVIIQTELEGTTMKTALHYYRFDISKPEQRDAYNGMCKSLRKLGLVKIDSISSDHHAWYSNKIKPLGGQEIELDTAFVFDNQWNTAEPTNLRVFDWSEAIYPDRDIKEGMWLEQTEEMREIRKTQHVCGYCEARYNGKPFEFCDKCLGSSYLKEEELFLLRLAPAGAKFNHKYPLLTEAEKAVLLPAYRIAQGLGKEEREKQAVSKNRQMVAGLVAEAEKKAEKAIWEARIKQEAYTWLLDNGLNLLDNCIYYSHTGRFCFGWRTPLTAQEKSQLLDVVSEFPFEYDIK
jgi:hypothetical protein